MAIIAWAGVLSKPQSFILIPSHGAQPPPRT
jgi:hypothetical protein